MLRSEKQSFIFDSVHLAPEEQIGLHSQSTWEVCHIIVGSGMRLIGDRTEPFQCGEVVMVPPDIPHCWYFDNHVTDSEGRIANTAVMFGTDFLDNCSAVFPELSECIGRLKEKRDAVKFDREKSVLVASILDEMRYVNAAERVALIMRLLPIIATADCESIIGKYRKIDKEKDRLNQIQIYVVCNARREITLDDVARHVGMNRASFCVFFKKATGKTFVNYLNEYRIELACQLLEEKKMAVSEICYQVGFNNVPYFNRVFKKQKGVAPTEYSRS